MPKVYLTEKDRRAAGIRRQNEVLARALRIYSAEDGQPDEKLAAQIGVSLSTLYRMKDPDNLGRYANMLRAVAHTIHLSREDWLKFGGYTPTSRDRAASVQPEGVPAAEVRYDPSGPFLWVKVQAGAVMPAE